MKILAMKRGAIGFLIGLALIPAIFASTALYLPYLFGLDPIFGGALSEVIKPGYVVTDADIAEIRLLSATLRDFAQCGLGLGVTFALFGAYSAWSDTKKNDLVNR